MLRRLSAPGAARGQADLGQPQQHLRRVGRRDFPQLQIGARGDVGVTAGEIVGDRGDAAQLMRADHAAGNTQPAHERVLRRRHVKQAVELGQEDIGALGELSIRRQSRYLIETIQRMLFALRFLLRRQLAAGGEGAILRGALQIVGIGRRGVAGRRGRQAERAAPRLDADHEAFQIFLLLGGESGVAHYSRRLLRCRCRGGRRSPARSSGGR